MTIKAIHLRTVNPVYMTNMHSCGEVGFCGRIGKKFTKNIKEVTCGSCLKSYEKMKKYLHG